MRTSERHFIKPEQNIIKAKIIIHVEIWKSIQKSTRELCKKAIANLMIALQTSNDKRQNLILGNFGIDIVSLELIQKLFQLKISMIFLKPQILLVKLMNVERMRM